MTQIQLSGSFFASRLGIGASATSTPIEQKIGQAVQQKIQSMDNVNYSLTNKSYLALKDGVGEWSNTVAMVQISSSDLDTIATYLSDIQSSYEELAGLEEGSQLFAGKMDAIQQKEADLSTFIGTRSVGTPEIALFSSADGGLDTSYFKTMDINPTNSDSETDLLAVLEVDMGKVLTSVHNKASCPICQANAEALSANMGVSVPESANAAATNSANVTGATTIGASGTSYIEPLRKGLKWDLSAGETISYSYYDGSVSYDSTAYSQGGGVLNAPLGISAISAANIAYLDTAFTAWDNVIDPAFQKVTESGTTVGELRSAYTTATYAGAGSAAYAYYPNSSVLGGDIWYVSDQATNSNFAPGTYGYLTALHEIGHAIGLSHPFDAGSATGATLATAVDIQRNTVMTYTQYDRNQYWTQNGGSLQSNYFYATTPGIYDVAAVEYIYGASTTTNTGNTVYAYTDWAANSPLIFTTLVDSSGADTFNASATTRSNTINLNPGSFSSMSVYSEAAQEAYWGGVLGGTINLPSATLYTGQDNVGIAYSATIENAIGGSAADTITGNSANNVIKGGLGNDTLDGAAGSDTAVFSGAKTDYTISGLGTTSITVTDNNLADGNDGTDALSNFEYLEFSDLTVDASDATGATTSSTGAGAIASAVAGAATVSSSSSTSSGSSSSGGGGGGGFVGTGNSEIDRRSLARYKAYQAQKRYEAWAAANPELAQAHLLSIQATPEPRKASVQAQVVRVATEAVKVQQNSVAEVARALYAQANVLTGSDVSQAVANGASARAVIGSVTGALGQDQSRANLSDISQREVQALLS
jgi:hypothetical protein